MKRMSKNPKSIISSQMRLKKCQPFQSHWNSSKKTNQMRSRKKAIRRSPLITSRNSKGSNSLLSRTKSWRNSSLRTSSNLTTFAGKQSTGRPPKRHFTTRINLNKNKFKN